MQKRRLAPAPLDSTRSRRTSSSAAEIGKRPPPSDTPALSWRTMTIPSATGSGIA
jgi:hypothetical protein